MDLKRYARKLPDLLKKYRYPLLVLLIGIALMWLPDVVNTETTTQISATVPQKAEVDVAGELADILAQIEGVGKVKVMLTLAAGESILYQTDEDHSDTTVRKDTVIITDSDRNDQGLVVQVLSEEYRGAIIVCQGGDKASVKLAVMEAVSKVTGLDPACISVLKMK